jgi:hypothetical protein
LSGNGYVDEITGSMEATGDADGFAFTVPAACIGYYTLSWDQSGDDLDAYLLDAAGNPLDNQAGATSNNPESGQSQVPLEPGTTYYLMLLGYDVGTPTNYALDIEQEAP